MTATEASFTCQYSTGTTLPNGAIVIDRKQTGPHPTTYVLCIWLRPNSMADEWEYVTWQIISEDGHCESGHYYPDLCDAVADFARRGHQPRLPC